MRLIDADKFLAEEFEAYIAVQADINADQGGLMEAKKLVNEIVHRKIVQLVEDADTVRYCANCGARLGDSK